MPMNARWLCLTLAVSLGACGGSSGGATAASDGGTDAGGSTGGPGVTSLMGKLGDLGAVLPTVSSKMISNSGETLIYLTSAPLSCDELKVSRWLGAFAKGSQVVEIVFKGPPALGAIKNPEVNYAPGGKSSAYEKSAIEGSTTLTFTKAEPMGVVEGSFSASYANPTSKIKGTFHAEFCEGGQGY